MAHFQTIRCPSKKSKATDVFLVVSSYLAFTSKLIKEMEKDFQQN